MWDENQRRRHHHRRGEQDSHKGIHIAFFVFHGISVLLGFGLFVVSHITQAEEKATMGDIELNVTGATGLIYNICGGVILFTVVVGLTAQFFRKTFLFLMDGGGIGYLPDEITMLPVAVLDATMRMMTTMVLVAYCVLMSIIALSQFSAAGTSFGSMGGHEIVTQRLKELMMDYGNSNHKNSEQMTAAWDILQEKYQCCGVNNYTDWQTVDFGLTSLKVPTSCCLKEKWALNPKDAKYCGQNLLPDSDKAQDFIFVNGCLGKVMSQLDRQLFILGVFGLIVGIFNVITIVFACFLVITKRV